MDPVAAQAARVSAVQRVFAALATLDGSGAPAAAVQGPRFFGDHVHTTNEAVAEALHTLEELEGPRQASSRPTTLARSARQPAALHDPLGLYAALARQSVSKRRAQGGEVSESPQLSPASESSDSEQGAAAQPVSRARPRLARTAVLPTLSRRRGDVRGGARKVRTVHNRERTKHRAQRPGELEAPSSTAAAVATALVHPPSLAPSSSAPDMLRLPRIRHGQAGGDVARVTAPPQLLVTPTALTVALRAARARAEQEAERETIWREDASEHSQQDTPAATPRPNAPSTALLLQLLHKAHYARPGAPASDDAALADQSLTEIARIMAECDAARAAAVRVAAARAARGQADVPTDSDTLSTTATNTNAALPEPRTVEDATAATGARLLGRFGVSLTPAQRLVAPHAAQAARAGSTARADRAPTTTAQTGAATATAPSTATATATATVTAAATATATAAEPAFVVIRARTSANRSPPPAARADVERQASSPSLLRQRSPRPRPRLPRTSLGAHAAVEAGASRHRGSDAGSTAGREVWRERAVARARELDRVLARSVDAAASEEVALRQELERAEGMLPVNFLVERNLTHVLQRRGISLMRKVIFQLLYAQTYSALARWRAAAAAMRLLDQSAAAVQIQRIIRGFLGRRRAVKVRQLRAKQQARELERQRAQHVANTASAVRIQRHVRAWLARRLLRRLRTERHAAITIQCALRCYYARRLRRQRAREFAERTVAAIAIQRIARGWLARRHVAAKRLWLRTYERDQSMAADRLTLEKFRRRGAGHRLGRWWRRTSTRRRLLALRVRVVTLCGCTRVRGLTRAPPIARFVTHRCTSCAARPPSPSSASCAAGGRGARRRRAACSESASAWSGAARSGASCTA